MTKKHICYGVLILLIVMILYVSLFVLHYKNTMLKNELDAINTEYVLLIDTNSAMSQELKSVKSELEAIKQELEEIKKENLQWSIKYNQYPTATIAWIYMTEELGWSDIVAAGIIGNMMAECGGQTLNLDWDVKSRNGYGLIQWIGERRAKIIEKYGETPTVVEQIEFMKGELYGTNGVTKQVTDSQLEAIMNADTPEECAFAFACYYERCHEDHRAFRRGLARTAYNYFTA